MLGLTRVKTENQGTLGSGCSETSHEAPDDMYDTLEEIPHCKPLADALQRCDKLIKLYDETNCAAYRFKNNTRLLQLRLRS